MLGRVWTLTVGSRDTAHCCKYIPISADGEESLLDLPESRTAMAFNSFLVPKSGCRQSIDQKH